MGERKPITRIYKFRGLGRDYKEETLGIVLEPVTFDDMLEIEKNVAMQWQINSEEIVEYYRTAKKLNLSLQIKNEMERRRLVEEQERIEAEQKEQEKKRKEQLREEYKKKLRELDEI